MQWRLTVASDLQRRYVPDHFVHLIFQITFRDTEKQGKHDAYSRMEFCAVHLRQGGGQIQPAMSALQSRLAVPAIM